MVKDLINKRILHDLIIQDIDSVDLNDAYLNLNNFGFLCVIYTTQWQEICNLVPKAENIEPSKRKLYDGTAFYNGLKFYEMYIRKNYSFVIFRKIFFELKKIPCPSCLDVKTRNNGYNAFSLPSWECSNPLCEDKSSTGRGKRFSEDSLIMQYASTLKESIIPNHLLKKYRRDVENVDVSIQEILDIMKYRYSFPFSKIKISLDEAQNKTSYLVDPLSLKLNPKAPIDLYEKDNIKIFHADSKEVDYGDKLKDVNIVFTSPPYFNARDYSFYKNLEEYYVFLCSVFSNIQTQKNVDKFFINISDVVCADPNVSSLKKRMPLSFYLIHYLSKIGIYLNKVWVWDKGEPQSKKHLNPNKTAVYSKPLNAYEFVFELSTHPTKTIDKKIFKANPVVKIHNKNKEKVNKIKHTAPFPIHLLDTTLKNVNVTGVVDPFLGSGTTAMWCKEKGLSCVGVEIHKEYFDLSVSNVDKTQEIMFKF